MGKVIGGGMPLAAFGAKRAVMEQLAPLGAVYQAGTLSGNPVATACGLATLKEIQRPGFFESLSTTTRSLVDGLTAAAKAEGVPFCGDSQGGMFTGSFSVSPGVFVYQITDTGLAAQATVSGTKFFNDDALN